MAIRTPSMRLVTALCCLVALSALAGVGAADSHTGIDDAPDNETLGDVVELTVSVPEKGTATVVLESTGEAPYDRTIVLTDASGDGVVTLQVNTFLGQQGDTERAVYTASGDDTATVRERIGTELSATEYAVEVYNGTGTDGTPEETASVELTAPTDGSVSYLTGPRYASGRLETLEDIRQGQREGWLNDSANVTTGETLVFALNVDGLGGAVAASDASNDTERFLAALDRPNTTLEIELDEIPMLDNPTAPLNRSNIAAAVTDRRNDTYYVVLDTSDVGFVPERNDEVEDGDELEPVLTVAGQDRPDTFGTSLDAFTLYAADGDGFDIAVDDPPEDETLGDVLELGMWLPGNETAKVVVQGTGDVEYRRQVELTDSSGDGRLDLAMNTFTGSRANWTGAVYTAGANDTVSVSGASGALLTAGTYNVSVYAGNATDVRSTAREPAYTTALTVAEQSDGSVSYSVARSNVTDRLDTRSGIERARRDGSLVEVEDEVVSGDTVVLGLRVDGLEGAVAASRGANDPARFRAMLTRTNTSLKLETLSTPMMPTRYVHVNGTDITAVVADAGNDTYHVVLNTTAAGITPATNDQIEDGDELDPVLVVDGKTRLEAESGFDIGEHAGEFLSDARGARGGNTTTVRGKTNLAPGSEVVVRLAANGTAVSSASATVGPERRFAVTLDVAEARRADSTTLALLHDGAEIETVSDPLVLSVPEDQSIADGELYVPSVWLPSEGYVHVVGPDGAVVGRSDELTKQRYHNLTIALSLTEVGPGESLVVVPSDDETIDPGSVNYNNAFLVDVPPAGIAVNVTTVTETPPTQSVTPTGGETATRPTLTNTNRATATATGTGTTAADGTGFGVLAALLAGLLALGAGALRRQ